MGVRTRRIALASAATYLLAVAMVVFWPTPVDQAGGGTLRAALSWLHSRGMPGFVDYNFVEFCANIAMFVPMGFIASAFFRKSWLGLIAGVLGSCLIELGQALLLPDRFATGQDVLANTMGAGLGAWLYFLLVPPVGRLVRASLPGTSGQSAVQPAPRFAEMTDK